MKASNCHLVFDFGHSALKASFLSANATVQLYWPDSWEAIKNTPRYKYGLKPEQRMLTFSVALALDFGDFVVSFNGPDDLVFSCEWTASSCSNTLELGGPFVVDVLGDWPGYMHLVVHWLEDVYPALPTEEKETCIAIFLHEHSGEEDLFAGVTNHSRSEVLFRAGLSPNLTLREVVDSRSRFYRLILATWQYKYLVMSYLWPRYVRPAIRDRKIAPTFDQRLELITKGFWVHGQNPLRTTSRYRTQIMRCNQRAEAEGSDSENDERVRLFDAFEPSLLEDAIRHAPEFCPAIFNGTFWADHKSELEEHPPWLENPLVIKDSSEGLFALSQELICTTSWTTLLLPPNLNGRLADTRCLAYSSPSIGEIWSPLKLTRMGDVQVNESPLSLGRTISSSRRYGVGVLESPGNAMAIRSCTRHHHTHPSRGAIADDDPAMYQVMRKGLTFEMARISSGQNKLKRQAVKRLSEEERVKRQRAEAAFDEMWIDRFGCLPRDEPEEDPRPVKRRAKQLEILTAAAQKFVKPEGSKRVKKERGISMTIDKEKAYWE
ncbi:unnamed protein product [Peniophora sp. CBMAI 1063]|nr:unnamed protein product [Peniophora sp. CBMAI 1063]